MPGDRGFPLGHIASYPYNSPSFTTSGHESCRASKGNSSRRVRSTEAKHRHIQKCSSERHLSRRLYRQYLLSTLYWRGFTFTRPVRPLRKVQVSKTAQLRITFSVDNPPTATPGSVLPSLLPSSPSSMIFIDGTPALLSSSPIPAHTNHLFSQFMLPVSQLQDLSLDQSHKDSCWNQLHSLYSHHSSC